MIIVAGCKESKFEICLSFNKVIYRKKRQFIDISNTEDVEMLVLSQLNEFHLISGDFRHNKD